MSSTTNPRSQPDSESTLPPQDPHIKSKIVALLEADAPMLRKLITGAHILDYHNILDGFGHLSARSPTDPSLFYITSVPAALVTTGENYTIYHVHDGTPLDRSLKVSPYSEHHIHATFYAAYPELTSVLHSHAREVLPYTVTSRSPNRTLKAVMHTAGFLGRTGPPVWDAGIAYRELVTQGTLPATHPHDLLVNTYALGQHLATAAAAPDATAKFTTLFDGPVNHHKVVLQRGHGFTVTGQTIEEAVYNAYYTVQNAVVLSEARRQSGGGGSDGEESDLVQGLSQDEVEACTDKCVKCIPKAWPLWVAQVERSAFRYGT